ncbi:MAG: protein kinase [Synechococcus sp.]
MTEIGQLLKSRYLISNLLSGGGFSVTYLAKDTHLPDYPDCVVKQLRLLSNDLQQVEKVREFFFNEAKMLRKLGAIHGQIPELLAYFTDEDSENFYIVQEHVPGKTLKQILGTDLRLTEPEVIYILKEALEVLEFVHSYNVIHLDIKPDNLILRESDFKIALIDFGSVKQVRTQMATSNSLTPQTTTLGTPGYMPCEQSFGRPKLSSDFYALGMVAIRALTGIHPKELEEDLATGEVIWKERTHIRPELKTLIDQMVRYHFNQRPQSASDILIELAKLSSFYSEDVTCCSARLKRMVGGSDEPSQTPISHDPTRPSDAMRARYEMPTIVASEPASLTDAQQESHQHAAASSPSSSPTPALSPTSSSSSSPSKPSLTSMPPGLISKSDPQVTRAPSTASTPRSQRASAQPVSTPIPQDSLAPVNAYPDTILVPPQTRGTAPVNSDTPPSGAADPRFKGDRFTDSKEVEYLPDSDKSLRRQFKIKVAPVLVVTTAIGLGMLATWGGGLYLEHQAYTAEDRQQLRQARELADSDVDRAIEIARGIQSNSPFYPEAVDLLEDLQGQQVLARERELLTQARDLSVTDLEAALTTVREIPSSSPLYEEARLEGLEWQGQLLEQDLAGSSQTLATLAPQIEIRADVLYLQYDGSSDEKLIGEEGIRRVAIATMSVVRSRYTDFDQLVAYPEGENIQGMLDLDLWTSYEQGEISLEQLLSQIKVGDRSSNTPDQVASYTSGRWG